MTPGEEVVNDVMALGGRLWLGSERLHYRLPESASSDLLPRLRQYRDDVVRLLSQAPPMPPGVTLVEWRMKEPPIALERISVVVDPEKFAVATLLQLDAALHGRSWEAGNRSVKELIDRLATVGVRVRSGDSPAFPQPRR